MDQISTAVSGIILFVIFSFLRWYIKRQKFCNLVDLVPGPTAYPLIGTTYAFFGKTRDELFTVVNQRTAIYPYIHRIWIGPVAEVRVSKAEYVEQVLCSTKHIEKSYLYKFIKPWLGDGLLISKGKLEWNRLPTSNSVILLQVIDGTITEKSSLQHSILASWMAFVKYLPRAPMSSWTNWTSMWEQANPLTSFHTSRERLSTSYVVSHRQYISRLMQIAQI